MSVGGSGIPRLQDLSYLAVGIANVAAGATFEQIRRALVSRAADLARDSDTDGSFDDRKWDKARADHTRYVYNTVDVLKELMRLGWIRRHILPSGPKSAYLHAGSTFQLTEAGEAWTRLVSSDQRAGYNALTGTLIAAHPQFEGYLRVVGARPDSTATHLSIPLFKPTDPTERTGEPFLGAFIAYATDAVSHGSLGWTAAPDEIDAGIRSYVRRIFARAEARKKALTAKDFANTCEEAITRLAFASAGCRLDYISHELLRRWTRFLGLANFSYYAPGPSALRLWSTSGVTGDHDPVRITRRVGPDLRRQALQALSDIWRDRRTERSAGMYQPVWQIRAAVCWKQRISDAEFDIAIIEALTGKHADLGLRIHLDQASLRATPASTRPLIIPTASGLRRVFNVISVSPPPADAPALAAAPAPAAPVLAAAVAAAKENL